MLIIALVLAVVGLASLVAAVVTSNEVIAWVCIGASVIGVVLLIVDALRDRSRHNADEDTAADEPEAVQDYPDEEAVATEAVPADTADEAPDTDAEATDTDAEATDAEAEHKG
jgi:flagellar biosynthesis/type III secretory pathway M-ring protein FliF/YscJ